MSKTEHIYVAPRTPIEEMLVKIWAQVLGCERVGIKDQFQDLGGTSLHATRIFSRLRDDLGVNLSRSLILQAPTIAQMAEYIEATCYPGNQLTTVATVTRAQGSQEDRPASFLQ